MAKSKRDDRDKWLRGFRVPAGGKFSLARVDADSTAGLDGKRRAREELAEIHKRLVALQEVLYAEGKHALLVIIQAMDTGGKDSTIRHVFGPLNPQGVRVTGFKVPTPEELAHDFLWRVHREVPRKGMIGIFNRSHYEDVLVVRVHGLVPPGQIRKRYGQINAFEKHLTENGVTLLKFCLHISKEEQKERLQSRLDRPDKHWKFNTGDLAERKLWGKYMRAYETALTRCSTPHAPWYVVPANRKWYRDVVIGRIVLRTLEGLDLQYPEAEPGLDKVVIGE
jgi:PPK2 family polyphosphate:nucleotide phosphotransferase